MTEYVCPGLSLYLAQIHNHRRVATAILLQCRPVSSGKKCVPGMTHGACGASAFISIHSWAVACWKPRLGFELCPEDVHCHQVVMREKEVHGLERDFWGHVKNVIVNVSSAVRTRKIVEVVQDTVVEIWAGPGSIRTPGQASVSVVVLFPGPENPRRRKVCMRKPAAAGRC